MAFGPNQPTRQSVTLLKVGVKSGNLNNPALVAQGQKEAGPGSTPTANLTYDEQQDINARLCACAAKQGDVAP